MRVLFALTLFLGVLADAALAQGRRRAPAVGGFAPGQLRSQAAGTLPCEAVRDSSTQLDSLYTGHVFTKCTREQPSQVWLYFVRDTLVRIEANQQNTLPPPPIPSGPVFEFDRFMRTVWEQHRARATALFGGPPDSVSLLSHEPNEYGQLRVTVIAHWLPTTGRWWTGQYTLIGLLHRGELFVLALAEVQDPCVTTVPWLSCARPH